MNYDPDTATIAEMRECVESNPPTPAWRMLDKALAANEVLQREVDELRGLLRALRKEMQAQILTIDSFEDTVVDE